MNLPLTGLKILCLESRRSEDLASLLRRHGAEPTLAPSVKERSVEDPSVALRLVDQLESGDFDILICMTGVGLAFLRDAVAPTISPERLGAAFRRAAVISRGPKPIPILRSLQVPVAELIPEPNTWREVVAAISKRITQLGQTRIAIQEYGRPNLELTRTLESLGATVTPFALYRWELPDNLEPLIRAAEALATGSFDVILFTSSIQLDHLLEVAQRKNLTNELRNMLANNVVIASIGPVMTEALISHGFKPDIEPQSPNMGALVKAVSENAAAALTRKRAGKKI